MSLFARHAAASRGVAETVHGDAIRVIPMDRLIGPNGKRLASVEVPAFDWTGLFYQDAEAARLDVSRVLPRGAAPAAIQGGSVTISVRAHPQHGFVQAGWRIVRLSDHQAFDVSSADPDGLGHITLTLSKAANP